MHKLFEWSEEFSICEPIDSQHKRLIDLINTLYDAFVNAKAREVVKDIIQELLNYADYHFKTEEELFEKFNYSAKDEHIEQHNFLRQKADEFQKRFNSGDEFLMYDIMTFLRDWLKTHILSADKKYKDEICKN